MKRYLIIFSGIVQGVGFRWTILSIARSLNVTGYVKNLLNGTVQVEIQGKQAEIDEFIRQCYANQRFVRIDDYSMKEIEVEQHESGFSVH